MSVIQRLLYTTITLIMLLPAEEVSAYSPKEGNVLATLGIYTHASVDSPEVGDVAFFLNGDLNDRGQLEIGILHLKKRIFRQEGGLHMGEESDRIHITMGYRHWFANWLSAGLAFSSSYAMGDTRTIRDDFTPRGLKAIDTSASDTTEYGFDFSLQWEVFSYQRLALIADAIYSLSVTGKPNETTDHYGVMLGIRYFIQEKPVVEKPKTSI